MPNYSKPDESEKSHQALEKNKENGSCTSLNDVVETETNAALDFIKTFAKEFRESGWSHWQQIDRFSTGIVHAFDKVEKARGEALKRSYQFEEEAIVSKRRVTETEIEKRQALEALSKEKNELEKSVKNTFLNALSNVAGDFRKYDELLNSSLKNCTTSLCSDDSTTSTTTLLNTSSTSGNDVSVSSIQASNEHRTAKVIPTISNIVCSTPVKVRMLPPSPKFQTLLMNQSRQQDQMNVLLQMVLEMKQTINICAEHSARTEFFFKSETTMEFLEFHNLKKENPDFIMKQSPKAIQSFSESGTQTDDFFVEFDKAASTNSTPVAPLYNNIYGTSRMCVKCNILYPGRTYRDHMLQYHKLDLTDFCTGCAKLFAYAKDVQSHRRNCMYAKLKPNSKEEREQWVQFFHNTDLRNIVKERDLNAIYQIYKRYRPYITRVSFNRHQFEEAEKKSFANNF